MHFFLTPQPIPAGSSKGQTEAQANDPEDQPEYSVCFWPSQPSVENPLCALRLSVYDPSFSLAVGLQGQPNQQRNERRNAASLVVRSQDWPMHTTQIHIIPSAVKTSCSSIINSMHQHIVGICVFNFGITFLIVTC